MKLHYKLFITFGSIIAAALIFIFVYLDNSLNKNYILQLKDNIKKQTLSVKYMFSKTDLNKNSIDELVHGLGAKLGLRITIIDYRGIVLGDSDLKHNEILKLENHLQRPEIQSAVKTGEGWSQRFSTTLKKNIIYYATTYHSKSFNGFIRLSIPVEKVSVVSHNTEGILSVSLFVVFIATLLVALIAFNLISKPIRVLAARAHEMAKGDFSKKLVISKNDEVGELANSLNIMSENIVGRINEILNNNSKFEAVLLSMFDGVMVLDSNGIIQLMNKTMQDTLQIKDNPVGKKPIEVIRNVTVQDMAESVLNRKEGVITKEENLIFPYNKTMLIHATPVARDNKILGAVIVFSDITELRRLETIRKDFVANVSHELRTPISSIKGYAETLLDGAIEDNANASEFVKIIHGEAERLASLINDILDLSKIESDTFKLKFKTCTVNDLVTNSIERLDRDAKDKKISIENKTGNDEIKIEENLIIQAMINLIHNAIKYSNEGGKIIIRSEKQDKYIKIEIEDFGIGIPEKDLPRIFERFYRVDKARSKELGGTGLGLAIVKHIIQSHGGEVFVKSVEGHGSVFGFTLPVDKQPSLF
ncbi:MAG: ATP-binding protein [Proteobacteria bacterium]|nr:ATP-binding protein [Pseudomonadota bacterium]